jgi:hypothetical protein
MGIPWIPIFVEIGSPGENPKTTAEAIDLRETAYFQVVAT